MKNNRRKSPQKFKNPFTEREELLIAIIGPKLMVKLSTVLGGSEVYIPKVDTVDSEIYRAKLRVGKAGDAPQMLYKLLGYALLVSICTTLGGSELRIPALSRLKNYARNQEIVRDYNGRNAGDLAIKHNLSKRNVNRILWNDRTARDQILRRRKRDKKKARERQRRYL